MVLFFSETMNKNQIEVINLCDRRSKSPTNILSSSENQQQSSSSLSTCETIPSCIANELITENKIISNQSLSLLSKNQRDQQFSSSTAHQTCNKSKSIKKSDSVYRRKYLSAWEKQPEAMYKTYVFDEFGKKSEKLLPGLYLKDNTMRCCLCVKYGKRRNTNGE
jgi:hypothetical protein